MLILRRLGASRPSPLFHQPKVFITQLAGLWKVALSFDDSFSPGFHPETGVALGVGRK